MKKLLLLDGNSLLFRSFYALPILSTREGEYTNAVYGFLLMLKKLLKEEKPTHLLVAFDKHRVTFRNAIYTEYKGTRKDAPDELIPQFALIRETLRCMNLPYIELEGYEADDILGTVSLEADQANLSTVIVSGDRDILQLVSGNTWVYLTKKGITDIEKYDAAAVEEKLGVRVDQIIDLKGLMGDSSDNIPGVPGVGPKTAVKLLTAYDNLEGLYAHTDELKGKLKENLLLYRDNAFMSRTLATIVREAPLPPSSLETYTCQEPDWTAFYSLCQRLEFKQFLTEVRSHLPAKPERHTPMTGALTVAQGELFAESAPSAVPVKSAAKTSAGFFRPSGVSAAFYAEPDNLHPMWHDPKRLWLTGSGGEISSLPVDAATFAGLKSWLEDPAIEKYFFNSKSCRVLCQRHGITLAGVKGDLMLLTYVLDPGFTGETLLETLDYHRQVGINVPTVSEQVSLIEPLYKELHARLDPDLAELLDNMELPVAKILADMEFCGVQVDREVLREISAELAGRITTAEQTIYRLSGREFNLNSPKQLGQVLFEDLQLPGGKKTKSGYSTGAEVLEKLYDQHEIIAHILDYRQLAKLKSTYADALPALIHPETGRVHTVFKQALTATGRLSSVEPNLQNIPIRLEEGRRIRKAFVGRDDSYALLSADYSQIDLRVLAHISTDANLIETFRQNIDIHRRTAAEIFHIELEAVDENMRRRAKAVNFGIIYGISPFGLARDTGVSREEAKRYIEEYLASYPGVQDYMHDIVEYGKATGYVETIFHRRRYLPDLKSSNYMQKSFAERMALNTPIQGSSADIIKVAMVEVQKRLHALKLPVNLLLQVHDELVFEVKKPALTETALVVRELMENACELRVPLLTTLKSGADWKNMYPLELP
jgi:DNA polymerase-1